MCSVNVLFISSANVSAGQVTITGTVNGDYQIMADDGQLDEVAETGPGEEVTRMAGTKVRVTGMVKEGVCFST